MKRPRTACDGRGLSDPVEVTMDKVSARTASGERMRRKPINPRPDIMPLSQFSEEKQREIAWAVEQPYPPDKWIYFGTKGNPRPVAMIESRAWYEWHWARGIDPDKVRPSLSASTRKRIIERDGYVCGICGGDVEPGKVDIDHIKPWSKGGSDHPDNLRVAHQSCNRRRGAREDH